MGASRATAAQHTRPFERLAQVGESLSMRGRYSARGEQLTSVSPFVRLAPFQVIYILKVTDDFPLVPNVPNRASDVGVNYRNVTASV